MVIGVTGKYSAGKDQVTRFLVEKGFREINVDAVGHQVLEEKRVDVLRLFGHKILDPAGSINRKALGQIVFHNKKNLGWLEALLHPRMTELVQAGIRQEPGDIVINAALLFPMDLARLTDCVIIVTAPFITRLVRARKRDRLGIAWILRRMLAGRKIVPKNPPKTVDIYYVGNSRSEFHTREKVEQVLRVCKGHGLKKGIT